MAVFPIPLLKPLHIFLLLLHFSLAPLRASPSSDLEALMAFKAASDSSNNLAHWNASSNSPCSWRGVSCTPANRVSRLVLEGLDLRNSFEPLTALTQLRVLSLKQNRLSGQIPDLSNLTSLKLLFLSYNSFSGDFPGSVTSLSRLYRLDLSHNGLTGSVPVGMNRLTHLLTLRLESNRLTGSISGLNLPHLQELNVSENTLSGQIPKAFSVFPESAFSQNPNLCGYPTRNCTDHSNQTNDPAKPGYPSDGAAIASPVVSSSPTAMPANMADVSPTKPTRTTATRAKIGTLALTAIILGDVLVIVVITLLLYCYYSAKLSRSSKMAETEKIVYSSSPYPAAAAAGSHGGGGGGGGSERGRMVFFEGVRRFELEDLLRASAEMLGKGGFGTAYKAVLDEGGGVVAVKRLKEAQFGGRREFEQQMEVLGRMRNPNLVSLRAYYFAREEKLLVYDYMPNGSLFWLLHGNRGPGRTPLDWTTRLKIAGGSARGLAFIHGSSKSVKLIHGNIKSTNILIDKSGNACVSDFGLSSFATSSSSSAVPPRSNGYRAPEALDGRRLTQKSDVYSYGVLLLEILTGKYPCGLESGGPADLPRWVQSVVREEWTAEVFDLELMRYKDIEEEMVGLLQIALACTSAAQDQRPKMSHVAKMIEELRGADMSPGHGGDTSVSESPSMSEDTCGATSQ